MVQISQGDQIRSAAFSTQNIGLCASTGALPPPSACIEQYLEDASIPLESQAFFVTAACMCADISGFTALSEKHCSKGTAGLDTLVQVYTYE